MKTFGLKSNMTFPVTVQQPKSVSFHLTVEGDIGKMGYDVQMR
jgi:hypothetical protein